MQSGLSYVIKWCLLVWSTFGGLTISSIGICSLNEDEMLLYDQQKKPGVRKKGVGEPGFIDIYNLSNAMKAA